MSTALGSWRKTILNIDSKIKDAIGVLNVSGLRIVLVVDDEGTFLGTISDGDIRRGLLRGFSIDNPSDGILHREAIVVPEQISSKTVMQLMTLNRIQQIPIVDENQRLVGLHLWDEIIAPVLRPNIFVIMAGGRGTRLGKETDNCPKPLLMVAGKPILEHIINRAKAEGFTHFVLAIHYLGHMIEEYFGRGEKLGVLIEYLREDTPLGTAGALSLLKPIPKLPVVVTNGDVLTDVQYGAILDFHERQNAVGTMAVRLYEWQNPFGVVITEDSQIIGYEEKPIIRSSINAGIYVLNPDSLQYLSKSKPCDMPSLFEQIRTDSHRVVAYPLHEPWIDVGRPNDLQEAQSREVSNGGSHK
jgi:dTDP-glucose pyrophosphorylase